VTNLPDKLASERGSVLMELLIAIPSTLAVFGAIAAMSGVFSHSQQVVQERSQSIEEQQVGAARMTREIRQATSATVVSPQELRVKTPRVKGELRFLCAGKECTRSVIAPDGTEGPRILFIDGITTDAVFSGRPPNVPNPAFVGISFDVGGRSVSIDDGVAVTNAPAP
jgi:hypothetical protein